MPSERLGILLISGGHERAHYAFVVAAGAAAIGRAVTLFATNEGCRALLADPLAVADAARDALVRARGVAGLAELRAACVELGVRLLACDAGLHIAGIAPAALMPGAEVSGVTAFLAETDGAAIVTL